MAEDLEIGRSYTAKDFAALRAFVQRIPPKVIARTYYDTDEDAHAATPGAMERYLRTLLNKLVHLAIENGSTVLADHLKTSVKKHGSAQLTVVTLKMVTEAAQLSAASPHVTHGIGMWFRPMVAKRLKSQGVSTLGDLIALCNRRGGTWWRSVPRIGAHRARTVVAWLRRHEDALGRRVDDDVDTSEPLVSADVVLVDGAVGKLAPLERMGLNSALSGKTGENRSSAFCYIRAQHDLDAVRAYLNQYRDQPKTLRAYTKELERFVLWSVMVRGKPMSSLLVDDCEAYKDFLKLPSPSFVGPRVSRSSERWRPFSVEALSPESQRYATRAIRAAFTWLVDVRYLAGNPWKAVNDPVTVTREDDIQIERALSRGLWERLSGELDRRAKAPEASQWRIARAAILLMGESGLRREEAAHARRENLRLSIYGTAHEPLWELTVIGKRAKLRTVPVSPNAVSAFLEHWKDRMDDFDSADAQGPLISPMIIPQAPDAQSKHADNRAPYHPGALGRLVERSLLSLIIESDVFGPEERLKLSKTTSHAFRHTFGTLSAAADAPLDVVQKILGHRSLQTTSIYVQAEKKRMMEEAGKLFHRD